MIKCDIITLTWNQLDIIKSFVESFLLNITLSTRLIIIDNGSTDGTKDYLLSLRDTSNCKFEIILNKENKGACKGRNQGIVLSNAPYICVVDNDVDFTKDWLNEIILIFERHKNIGIISPNSNALGTRLPKNSSLQKFAQQLGEKHKSTFIETPFCISFCMVIRRDVIKKVGGFSEEFSPIFFEDTDYSMKAQKAGYLVGTASGSYVLHQEHGSLKEMGEKQKEKFFLRSRKIFFKKWGKILRIAWIVNDYREFVANLDRIIALARNGNFVWIFTKDATRLRSAIFKRNNFIDHSGIRFIEFRNIFDLAWKILKKKKKYEPIIGRNKFIHWTFSKFGYKVLNDLDENKIEKIKKSII